MAKTYTYQYKTADELRVGDKVVIKTYEWVVDEINYSSYAGVGHILF